MKRIKTVDTIGHLCKVTESSYLQVKKGVLEDTSPADSLILNSTPRKGKEARLVSCLRFPVCRQCFAIQP